MDIHNQKDGSRKVKKDKSKRKRIMIHKALSKKVTTPRNKTLRVGRETKRPSISKQSTAHNKEMQGILDLISKFPQEDNYQSTRINDAISLIARKRLSVIDKAHMKYGESYDIGSDDYWLHMSGVLDEMISEYNVTLQSQTKDLTDKIYVSSSSDLIKELSVMNETNERIKNVMNSPTPETNDQKCKHKECIINAIEMINSLCELMLLKIRYDTGTSSSPLHKSLREKVTKLNNVCDIASEDLKTVTGLLYKFANGSGDTILEKIRVIADKNERNLISTHHLFSKIDN